ncbi:hypothetical protein ANTRET_LOCUS7771 [Anthophora retusa]
MFCLKERSNVNPNFKQISNHNDFGWWLSDESDQKSSKSNRSKDRQSVGSSESMLSCVDSDDSENYFLAQEFKQECNDNCEKIELTSLIHGDLDVNLIEQDAIKKEAVVTPFPAKDVKRCSKQLESERSQGICYTPERLIRSHEYRILTPSPRYLSISQPRTTSENENSRKMLRCRRRLNYSIESKEVGATQLKALLEPKLTEIMVPVIDSNDWENYEQDCIGVDVTKNNENEAKSEDTLNVSGDKKSSSLQIPDSTSKRSSYERLHVTWENCGKMGTRSSSLEDTSGIQSNDWSSDTYSDLQNTPLCLYDELTTTNYKLDNSQETCGAVNEVVSILKVIDTDPDKAAVLLEEDRFCDSTSSHDQLTRLALTIETDANVPGVLEDPENLIQHLQSKVKKLQASSKDIYRDISNLRRSFQCDEQKMADLSSNANKLRQDVHELRYLDDLLNLLRGELERISKRNWPFVIGRTSEHSEEMNLIV